MNEDQKRIKLLEILGWTDLKRVGAAMRGTSPKGQKNALAPNPFKNLNVTDQIETVIEGSINCLDYIGKIKDQILKDAGLPIAGFCGPFRVVRATAKQRSEAIGELLGLW